MDVLLNKLDGKIIEGDFIPLVGNLINANKWYGVSFVPGQSSTQVTPIAGDDSLLVSLPVHSAIRHATVNDDRTVNYWLDNYQLSKKADGSASDLTGADGQVMGMIPKHYRRIWMDGANECWAVSQYQLSGFIEVPARWIATFPATLETGDKLGSVSGIKARTNKTAVQFLQYARNRNADWYTMTYQAMFDLYALYLIEYADFNFQSAISAGLTNVNSTDWNNYNGLTPLYENGSNADDMVLNGEIQLNIENFVSGTTTLNTQVGVYRQFRLLTGIYEWLSGLNIHNSTVNGSRAYICDDPAKLSYDTDVDHMLIGKLVETDGYIKEMLTGCILPKVVGGSSSSYYSDYHYSYFNDDPDSGWLIALWFGYAHAGVNAGLACSYCHGSSGAAYVTSGSRLCAFVKR
jgi:hypothetical protein